MEHISQDANRAGNIVKGHAAVEVVSSPSARSKEPIGYGLCVKIGEILKSEVGNQVLLERLVESEQDVLLSCFFFS